MSSSPPQPLYQAVIPSPIPGVAYLGIQVHAGKLRALDFLGRSHVPFVEEESAVEHAVSLLQQYLSRVPLEDGLPLQPGGTAFQQRVWQRLRRIPAGEVMRYGELARELDSSARAVAAACRANPIPILIPCHRVIAAKGLGGYMGETAGEALAIKQWLLQHEGYV